LLDHCGFERTRRSDAAIAADEWRALAGVERTRAEQARPLGGPGDAVDLDVGEPEGAAGFAFDGATAEQAEPEREVGAGSGVDSLRAPAEELLVDAQAQARLPVWSSRWTTRWRRAHFIPYLFDRRSPGRIERSAIDSSVTVGLIE
jgi:hypothetical protein